MFDFCNDGIVFNQEDNLCNSVDSQQHRYGIQILHVSCHYWLDFSAAVTSAISDFSLICMSAVSISVHVGVSQTFSSWLFFDSRTH